MVHQKFCSFSFILLTIISIFAIIKNIESFPLLGDENISGGKRYISFAEFQKKYYEQKSKQIKNRERGDPGLEPPSKTPVTDLGMVHLPNFYLPSDKFKEQLDIWSEKYTAATQHVLEGFHFFIHEGLAGILGGLDHDSAFITAADPNLFKDMIAKYDEEQAAKAEEIKRKAAEKST